MANRYRNLIYSTAEYTHSYNGFRGVELNASSAITSPSRLAYSQNMYKDYDGDGADVIESVPGFRCFAHYGEKIHAIYYQRSPFGNEEHILVHVGNRLMRHPVSDIGLENAQGVKIATLENTKSFGFEYGRYFYIMDTKRILQISDDGSSKIIGDSGSYPYVPTTYVSGEAYEQRNLLSPDFKEEYYVADPKAYLFSSGNLKFSITDPNLCYCSVNGIDESNETDIYIPAYVNIADTKYKVMSIDDNAFASNTALTAVYLPEGIIKIGAYAFSDCTSLTRIVTPSTTVSIEHHAFSGCTNLNALYLGSSLNFIGTSALDNTPSLNYVDYALGSDELTKIDGAGIIKTKSVRYNSRYDEVKLLLPFHDEVEGISSVTVDGKARAWGSTDNGKFFTGFSLTFPSLADATGIKITVSGVLMPLGEDWTASMNALAPSTPYRAIVNCRLAEVFDGRIFFSGNPDFPNTVFYTERPRENQESALYVGRYNYFNDGIGSYKVRAMLAVRDMLAVFKEGDDASGSIFYHKKESVNLGPIDTIYPVAYVHSGICSLGGAASFLDDPVFLTKEGVMALNHENISYQRNIACRSHNVNYYLLKEDLSKACLCEWLGYLVVGINGKIFLADSRSAFTHDTGSWEYEWFFLKDIGVHNGDYSLYRYSPDPYADAAVHPTLVSKEADPMTVYSQADENGVTYYYVIEDGVKYHVVRTEERCGGEFCPATIFISHGNLLIFSTDDGHLCVFNNDMRGVAPDSVKNAPGYNADEYAAIMGNKLHPIYYSFAGHAPTYVVKTALDNCGIPHLTKNTVKKSLVIKAKSTASNTIDCSVQADENDPVHVGSFPYTAGGFESFDFSDAPWYASRYASVALPENEKRWLEKQITLTSHHFASPISVYSITYRYTIKGKIKNNI